MRALGYFVVITVLGFLWVSGGGHAFAKGLPQVGDQLGELAVFPMIAPDDEQGRTYLGLPPGQGDFRLDGLARPYVLLEIVGVYCPVCHAQAPDVVRLHQRIQRDAKLSGLLTMLAVAAGATPMEVEHLQKNWRFPFPIVRDEDYLLHKLLGEPDTPFTLVIDRQGNVLYAHLGRSDPAELFNQLKKVLR